MRGNLPDLIVITRDGVSEGQHRMASIFFQACDSPQIQTYMDCVSLKLLPMCFHSEAVQRTIDFWSALFSRDQVHLYVLMTIFALGRLRPITESELAIKDYHLKNGRSIFFIQYLFYGGFVRNLSYFR